MQDTALYQDLLGLRKPGRQEAARRCVGRSRSGRDVGLSALREDTVALRPCCGADVATSG